MAKEYSSRELIQRRAAAAAERKALILSAVVLLCVFFVGIYLSLFISSIFQAVDYRVIFLAVYFVGFVLTVLTFRWLRDRYYVKYYALFTREEEARKIETAPSQHKS